MTGHIIEIIPSGAPTLSPLLTIKWEDGTETDEAPEDLQWAENGHPMQVETIS